MKNSLLPVVLLSGMVVFCGCSMDPNAGLPVGSPAHLGAADAAMDVTLLSVSRPEADTLIFNMEFANTGGNAVNVDPELVITADTREHTWGYPEFTVKKGGKEFRVFDAELDPAFVSLIRSKGGQVTFAFRGQKASWQLTPSDFAGNSQPVQSVTPDTTQRKSDLSLQLLNRADFSPPLTYYQIDNSQRVGDDITQYAYSEAYMAAGMDNTTPFSFQEGLFRFPPGNASRVVETYNSNLAASMQRYSAGGFSVDLEKLPDFRAGDKGYAYRMKTPISTNYVAFFSKGDVFCLISVIRPGDGGEALLMEIAQKAEKKIVPS